MAEDIKNSLPKSLTKLETFGPSFASCFPPARACAWSDIAPLEFKGAMNMSGNVGGCRESTFHQTTVKICRKVMFYMIFFKEQKRDMTSSVTWPERFEYLSTFLKYIFRVVVLSTNIYTVLPLSNYTSIFKAKANEDWARSLKLRKLKLKYETGDLLLRLL